MAGMAAAPPKAVSPKRKLRWYQFSLRSLLIFTALCAIPCAWLGNRIEQKREESEAVAAIEKSGGDVRYDCDAKCAEPPGPAWMRQLLGEHFFCEVEYAWLRGGDAEMAHLDGLPQLKYMDLRGTELSDAGLAHVKGLNQLDELDLGDTEVTDAGLKHLNGMAQLKWISLRRTKVTDAGVNDLQKDLPNCGIYH
jgi:hypothetical protein